MNLKLRIERLQLLYDMLMEVHKGTWKPTKDSPLTEIEYNKITFHMDYWGHNLDHLCEFAACAYGHAMLDARFKGLDEIINIHFHDWDEDDCAQEYFQLTDSETNHIFMPSSYYRNDNDECFQHIQPIDVAKRVMNLIQETKNGINP